MHKGVALLYCNTFIMHTYCFGDVRFSRDNYSHDTSYHKSRISLGIRNHGNYSTKYKSFIISMYCIRANVCVVDADPVFSEIKFWMKLSTVPYKPHYYGKTNRKDSMPPTYLNSAKAEDVNFYGQKRIFREVQKLSSSFST